MDKMLRRSAAEAQSGWMMKPTRNRHSAIHKASWAWGCRQRQKGTGGGGGTQLSGDAAAGK